VSPGQHCQEGGNGLGFEAQKAVIGNCWQSSKPESGQVSVNPAGLYRSGTIYRDPRAVLFRRERKRWPKLTDTFC
jgi:hypothetical protein